MANVLNEEKKQQVLALGRLGWPLRRIQQETRIRRETASQYLKAAGIAVRLPGGWGRRAAKPANQVITDFGAAKPAIAVITDPNCNPKTNPENPAAKGKATSKPANRVITDSEVITDLNPSQPHEVGAFSSEQVASPQRSPSASACESYREAIELGLSRGRNAMAIYQDLVSEYSFASSYQSVQRFVRKLRGAQTPEARVVIITAPGQEAQVDYGTGPMVRDPETRKYRRTRLFVMTLGCSRKSVRLLTFRSSARIWAELHERAFRRFGGVTHIVVLDNLREGVLVPDVYDPALNPLYRDVLAHYGAVAMPCRIQDPDRKGKVESGVGHAQKTPLKGLRFESLEEAQAYLDRWEERWADTRIHGTTKRQVAAMFAEEKPCLLPLPVEPFRYYQYGERIVHLDGCVEVEAAYYGAQPGWIGRMVRVQWDELFVRLLDPKTGQLLREHVRQKRGWYRIKPEDHSKRTPLRTSQLLWRAGRAGTHIGTLCEAIHRQQGEVGVRRILGVLSLAKKYGAAAVDEACATALDMGVQEYRFVRRYLERCPQAPLSLQQVDPLIRELVQYRDFINHRTKELEE
ncbi:MAG: IS21 family transposase [Verrucomicrobia bacterium]|nr:MAG: IS21 family transposase [Verrucomicrobiota bacterium]